MKIDERLRALKDASPPDLWDDIVHREPRAAPPPAPASRILAAAVALALAAGGLAVAVRAFVGRDEPRPRDTTEPPTPLPSFDPDEPATLEFDEMRMNSVVSGFGSVWVTEVWGDPHLSLLRLDPETAELQARIPVSTTPINPFAGQGLAAGDGSVWIVSAVRFGDGREQAGLVRVDPVLNAEAEVIPLGGDQADDVEVGHGSIWVSRFSGNYESRRLLRLDPATYDVEARIPLGRTAGHDIVVAGESVWIPEYKVEAKDEIRDLVTRVDPQSNVITGTVDLGTTADFAVFEEELWALTEEGFVRIDPSNAMAGPEPVPVESDPVGGELGPRRSSEVILPNVAPGAGGLWFVQKEQGKLVVSRFNPETESIDASVDLPPQTWSPVAMAVTDNSIWVVDRGAAVHRVPLPPGIAG
jgi:streptogramin lyase